MKIVAVIQARMSSSRLPGKMLKPLNGRPLLQWVYEAVSATPDIDGVCVATSDHPGDDPLAAYVKANGWDLYRGSLSNVAQRMLRAGESASADAIVRICGDSPVVDFRVIEQLVSEYRVGSWELVTNVGRRTFPAGCSVEVLSVRRLKQTVEFMERDEDREHVTIGFYRDGLPEWALNIEHSSDLHEERLTIDTPEDHAVMETVLAQLERPHTEYRLEEIVDLRRSLLGTTAP